MFRVIVTLLFAVIAPAAEHFLNLGFEAVRGSHPRIWRSYGQGYEISADAAILHSGNNSLRIECRGFCSGTGMALQCFGAPGFRCFQNFSLDALRGKRIRYSGYIRTEGVSRGYAGLSWEVYGNDRRITYDDLRESGPRGTTPWTRYVIERLVDVGLTQIELGVNLAGNGKAWFDSLQIEIDGKVYPQPPPPVAAEPSARQMTWLKQNAIPFATSSVRLTSAGLSVTVSRVVT